MDIHQAHYFFLWAVMIWLVYSTLRNRKDISMASTRADLDTALDKLGKRLVNVLEDLKAKENPTPEDFDAAIAKVNGMIDTLNSDDPDNTNNDDPTDTPAA